MKKSLILLIVLLVGSASFAGMRIGAYNMGVAGGFANYTLVGMDFSDTISGDVGLAVGQNAAGQNSNIGICGNLEFAIGKIGAVKTIAGGNLIFASNPGYAASATSAFMLRGFLGAEYMVTKSLGIVGTVTLIELYSAGGTTQFGLDSGTVSGTGLGSAAGTLYSALRLYL